MATLATRSILQPGWPARRWANLAAAAAGFAMLLLVVLAWGYGLAAPLAGGDLVNDDGSVFMHDFLTHYAEGRLVLDGEFGRMYDLDAQHRAQVAAAGPGYDATSVYLLPPVAAWVFAPFALLPYLPAAVLWIVGSTALIAVSVRAAWEVSPLRGRVSAFLPAVVIAGSAPFAMNALAGNNAALWLAIYAFGLRALFGGREVAAGIVLGLGALKPQLFLAVPVLLLAQHRWRALAAWAATASGLAAVSFLMVGVEGARAYAAFLGSDRYEAEVAVANTWRMPSLPAFVRSLQPDVGTVAVCVFVVAVLVVLGLCIRRAPLPIAASAAVIVAVLVDPHVFAYDALVLVVPFLAWAVAEPGGAPRGTLAASWVLGWAMVLVSHPDPGSLAAVPWAVVPLVVLGVAALDRALRSTAPEGARPAVNAPVLAG